MSNMLKIPVTARLTEQRDLRGAKPVAQPRKPNFSDRPIGAPMVYEHERIRQLRQQRVSNMWRAKTGEAENEKGAAPESDAPAP